MRGHFILVVNEEVVDNASTLIKTKKLLTTHITKPTDKWAIYKLIEEN